MTGSIHACHQVRKVYREIRGNSPEFFNKFPATHYYYLSSWADLLAVLILVLLLTQSLLYF